MNRSPRPEFSQRSLTRLAAWGCSALLCAGLSGCETPAKTSPHQTQPGQAEAAVPAAGSPAPGSPAPGKTAPAESGKAGAPSSAQPAAAGDELQPLKRPFSKATLGGEASPTAGGPRVSWALPSGEVTTDLVGAVGFDRPMVPLSQVDDDVQVAWLRFSPAISVRARWVDTRTLRFAATEPLPRGSQWTLTVQGARDLSGVAQATVHTTHFQTPRLKLMQTEPRDRATGVGRRHLVALRFDQNVSEAAVRRAAARPRQRARLLGLR